MQPQLEHIEIEKLIPYVNNARVHSEEQVGQIAASIKEFGFINPIIVDKDLGVIAGHGRLSAARKLRLEKVPCLRVEHLSEAQKRAYILADNRLAELATWDNDLLKLEIEELKLENFSLDLTGFDKNDIEELLNPKDTMYTRKIEIPVYEPTRKDKPKFDELVDVKKFQELKKEIDSNTTLSQEERAILTLAAHRHIVFNYQNLAEYYAHSNKEVQELMESSALVIIDFNKAIEKGFVEVTQEIQEQFKEENNEV